MTLRKLSPSLMVKATMLSQTVHLRTDEYILNMSQVRKKLHVGVRLSATDSGHGCPSCQCGPLVASQLDSSAKQEVQLEWIIHDEDSKVQFST